MAPRLVNIIARAPTDKEDAHDSKALKNHVGGDESPDTSPPRFTSNTWPLKGEIALEDKETTRGSCARAKEKLKKVRRNS